MTKALLASAVAAMLAGGAHAAPAPEREARIAFPHINIRDFDPDGDDALYIEGRGDRWYRATLMGRCSGLPFAHAIGIDARGSTFDRFSTIIVDGRRCKLESLVRSPPPPDQREQTRG